MTVRHITTTQDSNLLDNLIGSNVFVRTVTHHHTGLLAAYDDKFLLLEQAAWVASDGRFANALASGVLDEVEPFPGSCLVAVGALVDICEWQHGLPREQK